VRTPDSALTLLAELSDMNVSQSGLNIGSLKWLPSLTEIDV